MTILFYPELPQPHNRLHRALTEMGIPFHNDPKKDHNIVFYWSYNQTVHKPNEFLKSRKKLVNNGCFDITKSHVNKVFDSLFIDPETYQGTYVRKSERQARHDGKIFTSPQKREPGYVYQEYIDTRNEEGLYVDYRVFWSGNIDMIVAKYKKDPFKKELTSCKVIMGGHIFSSEQINALSNKIRSFGMHFGEVDFLMKDGEPVIIDVNNIPGQGIFRHISSVHWASYKQSVREFLFKWPLLGGFSLGPNTVDTMEQHFFGRNVLELGSGKGSKAMNQIFTLSSIEDNPKFVKNYQGGTVYHVPIKDGWYDVDLVKKVLSEVDYDFLIMDGPAKTPRMKFYEHFHLFKKVPFLIDDTHKVQGAELVKMFENDGYKFHFIDEVDKQSAICLDVEI